MPGTGREDLSQNHLINFLCCDPATFYQRFHHHAAQVNRRVTRERSLKTADSCTQRTHYYDIFHHDLCVK